EDEDPASLPGRMRQQTEAAVRDADAALFMVDAREGLTPLDEEIGRWLRAESTPVIVVANKAEGGAGESGTLDAYRLGFGDPIAFSAEHVESVADLFQMLRPHVERENDDIDQGEEGAGAVLKLAIVGRPHAGKTPPLNQTLGAHAMTHH